MCISLWIRAKTVDQDERGNAERRALFVGLWPPMFWLMGDSLKDAELVREQLFGRVDESAVLDFYVGVRITGVINEERAAGDGPAQVWGWCCQTLEDHLEQGRLSYEVIKNLSTGRVTSRVAGRHRAGTLRDLVASAGAPGLWMPPSRELINRPGWA